MLDRNLGMDFGEIFRKSNEEHGRHDSYAGQTVIIVHGTFDEPTPGVTKRYQPGGSFCQALDQELQALGSDARC